MTHSPHELTPRTGPCVPCGAPASGLAASIPDLRQVFAVGGRKYAAFVDRESRMCRDSDCTPEFASVNQVVHINDKVLVKHTDAAGAQQFPPTMPREATI